MWTVLYTLSMLARYQPAEWSEYVDVDRRSFAVSIEQLLNAALSSAQAVTVYQRHEHR